MLKSNVTVAGQAAAAICFENHFATHKNGVCVMGTINDIDGVAERVVKGLNRIRGEASRLDTARAEGKSFDAKLALKTIKDECFHLRRYLCEMRETTRFE
jgi:hypothetical protein